jgi:hypothetical protein
MEWAEIMFIRYIFIKEKGVEVSYKMAAKLKGKTK